MNDVDEAVRIDREPWLCHQLDRKPSTALTVFAQWPPPFAVKHVCDKPRGQKICPPYYKSSSRVFLGSWLAARGVIVFIVQMWYLRGVEVKEEKFRVRTFECQGDGSINMFSLMRYLQEVAAGHAEQLGFGFDRLSELNAYWVLSNIRIEISRLPRRNDEVTLRTWPSGHTRTVATREFVGKDQNGCEIFRAGSEWMVLNKETNRLKNLFRLGLDLPKSGQKALPGELSRLELRGDYRPADQVRVPYSSIDLNGHVNNTEYVRWGIDALRRAFAFEGDISSLQATYLSEVFEGDEVDISVASDGNGKLYVLGSKSGEGNAVYSMEVVC